MYIFTMSCYLYDHIQGVFGKCKTDVTRFEKSCDII